MKDYIISEQTANEILNYLAGQPYKEVAGMIAKLGQIKEFPPPAPVLMPVPKIVPEPPKLEEK